MGGQATYQRINPPVVGQANKRINKSTVKRINIKQLNAEENLQAKSLKVFCQKYKPTLAVRTSMSDYRKESWLTNIPLYAISELQNIK